MRKHRKCALNTLEYVSVTENSKLEHSMVFEVPNLTNEQSGEKTFRIFPYGL